MSEWVTARAPAKVNWTLRVLGKRDDGFHELSTLMSCLELADIVRVRARDDRQITLRVAGPAASPDIPSDEQNLVWRAASRWLEIIGSRRGLDLELEKHIPSRAGLGGGSSDAAACLLGAASALGIEDRNRQSELLLRELGSDCVFFGSASDTGSAVCEGRGERVTPCASSSPAWSVCLVTPEVASSTPVVFRALEFPLSARREGHSLISRLLQRCAEEARPWLTNDLEEAAIRAYPELRSWRETLDLHDAAHFRMSGSGSTFYGIFDNEHEASTSLREIERAALARGLAIRASVVSRTTHRAAHVVDDS